MKNENRISLIIGATSGGIGALLGAIPIGALHYFLQDLMFSGRGVNIGGPYDLYDLYTFLFIGIPLPLMGIFVIPLGGVMFGIIGINNYLRKLKTPDKLFRKRSWLIGGIAGLLFNLFVSVWPQ